MSESDSALVLALLFVIIAQNAHGFARVLAGGMAFMWSIIAILRFVE